MERVTYLTVPLRVKELVQLITSKNKPAQNYLNNQSTLPF